MCSPKSSRDVFQPKEDSGFISVALDPSLEEEYINSQTVNQFSPLIQLQDNKPLLPSILLRSPQAIHISKSGRQHSPLRLPYATEGLQRYVNSTNCSRCNLRWLHNHTPIQRFISSWSQFRFRGFCIEILVRYQRQSLTSTEVLDIVHSHNRPAATMILDMKRERHNGDVYNHECFDVILHADCAKLQHSAITESQPMFTVQWSDEWIKLAELGYWYAITIEHVFLFGVLQIFIIGFCI
ncbi:hypothetical protein P154DRAFT_522700 [Amniculicola lignicola CBS 123094]|uniref:Uncharacterized protein n=1 Tax=Amniculicola lignicola CBS 123094 TaxID=1392246 RepID=A0A6A5WHD0_9PLEO|nr:hypothetical protein P154DRAFT_522700 [Amniculicola lignicola CBS 123094]